MIRTTLKTLGSTCLHAAGVDRLVGSVSGVGRQPLIVCYHRVVDDVRAPHHGAPAMMVSAGMLEQQLDEIGRRHRFVGLDEIGRALEEGHPFPRPVAAVTFDDGYADAFHNALPLLVRKGIPAAFFVVSGLIGKRELLVHDRLYLLLEQAVRELSPADVAGILGRHLPLLDGHGPSRRPRDVARATEALLEGNPRADVDALMERLADRVAVPDAVVEELAPLTWSMLATMAAAGMVVGSHTHTHRVLVNEPRATIGDELAHSKSRLEERLGIEVRHLAYPDGQHSPFSIQAAVLAGYRYAYTTCTHRSRSLPIYTIPRRTMWERTCAGPRGRFSRSLLACQTEGVFDLVRPCRSRHAGRAELAVESAAGSAS